MDENTDPDKNLYVSSQISKKITHTNFHLILGIYYKNIVEQNWYEC